MAETLTLSTLAGTGFELIDEDSGIVLRDHAYPPPAPEPFYASSADTEGERFLSVRYRNRTVSVGCEIAGATSEAVLANLQAHVAQIGREGGTLTWVTPGGSTAIFDLLTWTGYEPTFDIEFSVAGTVIVSMEFAAKPFIRGPEHVAYVQTTNRITNPSFEVDTTGWTNTGLASMARAAAPTGLPTGRDWSLRCQGNGANDNAYTTIAVTNGVTYTFTAYVYLDSSTATNVTLYALSDALAIMDSHALTTTDAWTRLEVTFTATSTATYYLAVQQTGAGNTDFYIASVQAETGAAPTDFFDGSHVGCAWTGTANASSSERYAFGETGVVSAKTFTETTRPLIEIPVTGVPGDVPALGKLEVIEADADNQAWLIWALQSLHYDTESTNRLFYEADDLSPAPVGSPPSGAVSASAASATVLDVYQEVTRGQLNSGGAYLSHIGTYRVFARCQGESGQSTDIDVMLEWSEGDGLRVNRNEPVTLDPSWAGSWRLLDLGQVTLREVPSGTQRWTPRVLAKGTSSSTDTVFVDYLLLAPVDEGAGEAAATFSLAAPSTYVAWDGFAHTAGLLAGKTATTGGTWAGVGDADDFATTGLQVSRGAQADTAVRINYLASDYTSVAVRCEIGMSQSAGLAGGAYAGLLARYTNASNHLRALLYDTGSSSSQQLLVQKGVAGVFTNLASVAIPFGYAAGTTHRMILVALTTGQWFVYLTAKGSTSDVLLASGQDAALATGGALATGRVGLADTAGSYPSTPPTRYYDNFAAWAPTADAALFASQSLEVRHDRVIREDSTGTYWSPVSSYEGDYLLLPPAGPDDRAIRVIAKASRGVPGEGADSAVDDISARLTATPRFLVVPS